MNRTFSASFLCVFIFALPAIFTSAQEKPHSAAPLVLTGAIPLPDVKGRIDHFAFDTHSRLFVSALGSDAVVVIDLSAQRVIHTITGVPRLQGLAYSPETNKLFVASDEGKLFIYDADSFAPLTSIDFGDDVDNLRYDDSNRVVFVGYGDAGSAAIAMVDVGANRRLAQEFKLPAHPESFQLELSGANIFVNLPDARQIAVINRETRHISSWRLTLGGNFPMALDEPDHRLFVAARVPARMAVFDTRSGQMLGALPCVQDSDDIYYDSARRRIYVTGGEGYISVFQQRDPDHYDSIAKIASSLGGRTSAYSGKLGRKGFDRFYVAVPARAGREAEVLIYTVQD